MVANGCNRAWRYLSTVPILLCLVSAAHGQSEPQPVERPDPIEIPIGTEANAPVEQALTSQPRRQLLRSMEFRIATWNLAARKPGETTAIKPAPKAPTKQWRHTFGAERKTAKWREIGKSDLGADIVALQGVTGRRTISRLFNARYYHIVVSRQLLEKWTTSGSTFAVYQDNAPPTTAVIYRRQRGVRIAGFRHFLPRLTKQQQQQTPAAITAFRLRVYRKMLWIASADMPADCGTEKTNDKCQGHDQVLSDFIDWAGKQVTRQKTPLLLLGQWPDTVKMKFSEANMSVRASTTSNIECAPAPSAIRVIGAEAITADVVTLDNPGTAETNSCVAIANLTMNLVD